MFGPTQVALADANSIKSIVVQILFRLNRQQQSNDKYKRKKTAHDDDPNRWLVARKSLFTKASSSAAHHAALSDPQSLCNKEFTTASFSLDTVASDLINPDLPARGTGQTEADPYMVPESPTSVARDVRLPLAAHPHELTFCPGSLLPSSSRGRRRFVDKPSPRLRTYPIHGRARDRRG